MSKLPSQQRFALRALVAAIGAAALPAHAATYTVTNTELSGPGSLAQAITDANADIAVDDITFAITGTLDLQNSSLPFILNATNIVGPGQNSLKIVRGDSSAEGAIFLFSGADSTISGLTLSGAVEGAINISGSAGVEINNVTFSDNNSAFSLVDVVEGGVMGMDGCLFEDNQLTGAANLVRISTFGDNGIQRTRFVNNTSASGVPGVWLSNTSLYLAESDFEGNTNVSGGPGAMAVYGGSSVVVVNSHFTDNTSMAGLGGAIEVIEGSSADIRYSLFDGNKAELGGGAIYHQGTGNLNIENSTFINNSADEDSSGNANGGAVVIGNNEGYINDSSFSGNFASGDGGGIAISSSDSYSMTRVTITDNAAGGLGGGLYASMSAGLTIQQSVISGNTGSDQGGAVWVSNAPAVGAALIISETTIADNSSSDGSAVALIADETGASLTVRQSTFSGNTGTDYPAIEINDRSGELSPGSVIMSNSTFSGNSATGAASAILIGPHNTTNLSYLTFVDNTTDDANAVQVQFATAATSGAASATLSQSAFSSSNGDDILVGGTPYGGAPADNVTVTLSQVMAENGATNVATGVISGALTESDPGLGLLSYNGGYTLTHAPAAESSAVVEAGTEGSRADGNIDQRGALKVGINTDLGAVEYTGNRAPVLIANLSTKLASVKDYALKEVNLLDFITDPDGDTVSLVSVDGLPEGVSVNLGSGVVSGTPTQSGTYQVTVVAEDDGSPVLRSVFRADVKVAAKRSSGSGGGGALAGLFGVCGALLLRLRRKR